MDLGDFTGLISTIGTQITNTYKAINTPNITIPGIGGASGGVLIGGQPYVPYQNTLTGSSGLSTILLFGAIGVLVVVLLRR